MGTRALLLGVALAAALWAGCSKHSSEESAPPQSVDLGTVELSAGQPSRHDLGNGAVCVITATPMGVNSLELIVALEKSGRQVASSRIVPAKADRLYHISVGHVKIEMTPHMK
jgi:hypothetical protein